MSVTVGKVESCLAAFEPEDRLDTLQETPAVADGFYKSLAQECAAHLEQQRLADPDEVAWYRRPRVGRRWHKQWRPRLRPITGGAKQGAIRDRDTDVLRTIDPPVYVELLTGAAVPPSGTILCPLPGHDERTPSFKAYDSPDRGWYCFGCNRGGSIIDLGTELWGLDARRDFPELRRRIAERLLGRAAA